MKSKKKKPELYSSDILDEIFQEITPEEMEKSRNKMLLAAKIDEAIKDKGWKKKDLAEVLKKQPSEITKWLSGTHNFTADTLWDIERVLDIKLINLNDKESEEIASFQATVSQEVDTKNYTINPYDLININCFTLKNGYNSKQFEA